MPQLHRSIGPSNSLQRTGYDFTRHQGLTLSAVVGAIP